LATKDILDPSIILAYPNPASDELQLDLTAISLRGKIGLNVFDLNGRLVMATSQQAADHMTLNVAGLQNGYYTLKVSSDKYIIGKKFMIVK
jgi:hypothetical protein